MSKFVVMAQKQVGKTTLVNRLIKNKGNICGFYTKRYLDLVDDEGLYPIYIQGINEEPTLDNDHLIGKCGNGKHYTNNDVFNDLGVKLITTNNPNDLIVMDEGKIIVNDLAKNLSKDFCQRNILSVDTCGDIDDVKGIFDIYEEVLLIDYIKKDDNNFTIRMELKKDTDIRKDVFKELSSLRMPINNMTLEPLTLEDLYGRLETFGEIPEAKIKSEKSKVVDIKTKRLKSQEDK